MKTKNEIDKFGNKITKTDEEFKEIVHEMFTMLKSKKVTTFEALKILDGVSTLATKETRKMRKEADNLIVK